MATSADLYQLSWVIEQLMADPRRIVQARSQLHMGQLVKHWDWGTGKLRDPVDLRVGNALPDETASDLQMIDAQRVPAWHGNQENDEQAECTDQQRKQAAELPCLKKAKRDSEQNKRHQLGIDT